MSTTYELLERALAAAESESALSRDLGLSRTTINTAKRRGGLSPLLAAKIADRMGLDPYAWMAQAATEAEPHITPPGAIRKTLANLRILSRLKQLRRPRHGRGIDAQATRALRIA